jgi:tRNA-guanine family transglycosylase
MPGQSRRAYVHHLVKSGEILGVLMTQHNLWFYQDDAGSARFAVARKLEEFSNISQPISPGAA